MGAAAAITGLEHPQGNRKRQRIWVDAEPFRTTNRRVVSALELAVGDRVDPEELSVEIDEEERRQAREHALRYLTYRARSHGELTRRLRDVGYGENAVGEVLAFLTRAGYLDDAGFAEDWIAQRVRIKHYGRRRIVAELVHKGIDLDSVAAVLDEYCPESAEARRAGALARKRLAGTVGLERLAAARRIGPYLLRKGYAPGAVSAALRETAPDEADTDVSELAAG